MGVIRKIIDGFDDSQELQAAQKAAVEALADMGEAKAELFKAQIAENLLGAGTGTNKTVPVESVIRSISQVRAFSSNEAGNIGSVVTDTLSTFLEGEDGVVSGIGKLITGTLSVFLGTSSGSSQVTEEYYVATEGLSCVRIDVRAWYYSIQAKSIRTKMEKLTCVVATKSVVDLTKIKFATFLNLYQRQLIASGMVSNDIEKALERAKAVYKQFRDTANVELLTQAAEIHTPPAALSLERAA